MSGQLANLYKVQKKDIPKASAVLADVFQHDPFWKKQISIKNNSFLKARSDTASNTERFMQSLNI